MVTIYIPPLRGLESCFAAWRTFFAPLREMHLRTEMTLITTDHSPLTKELLFMGWGTTHYSTARFSHKKIRPATYRTDLYLFV
jgi:hypothetical protein